MGYYTEDYKQQFLKLLESNGGNIASTCRSLKVARRTIFNWAAESVEFAESLREIKEAIKDNMETALYHAGIEGNVVAQIFYLKTQAPERGYIETNRWEFTQKDMTEEEILTELAQIHKSLKESEYDPKILKISQGE